MSKMNAGLLEDVRALARRAGEIVMDVYATDFGVRGKQDASPVTLADERAEEAIVAEFKRQAALFGLPTDDDSAVLLRSANGRSSSSGLSSE